MILLLLLLVLLLLLTTPVVLLRLGWMVLAMGVVGQEGQLQTGGSTHATIGLPAYGGGW
jgi:hypothetical protein